jgi:1-deoxyxylulose-5-phosphate synthase
MKQARIGASGLHVSRVGLGMMSFGTHPSRPWALDVDEAEPIIRRAVEGGITFFDTADVYGFGASEELTGKLVTRLLPRDELVLATKVFGDMTPGPNGRGLSRKHILAAIDASLRRLGVDHVDLYQVHRWDPETPIEETMEALHDVVRAGKARYIGASSMAAWQFANAQHVAARRGFTTFVSMQNHYNLLYREEEREMVPQCLDQGVGIVPWSPLARGLLTGRTKRAGQAPTLRAQSDGLQAQLYGYPGDGDVIARLAEVADARGLPPAQIALAWLLSRPAVCAPIVGATRASQLDDAFAAVELELTAAECELLEREYVPHPVRGYE